MNRQLLTLLTATLLLCTSVCFAVTGSSGTQVAPYPRVVVYSAPWCVSCNAAKEYLNKHNIPFTGKDIDEHPRFLDELSARYRTSAVPVIVIGNDQKVLRGFVPEIFAKAFREVWTGK